MFDPKVETRLRMWARWRFDLDNGNEGYPKSSIIALFQDGLVMREEFKSVPLIGNERAQEMDVWLRKMRVLYPDYHEVIVIYYLTNRTPAQIADALSISKRTFHDRIRSAKLWLSGCLMKSESYSSC